MASLNASEKEKELFYIKLSIKKLVEKDKSPLHASSYCPENVCSKGYWCKLVAHTAGAVPALLPSSWTS